MDECSGLDGVDGLGPGGLGLGLGLGPGGLGQALPPEQEVRRLRGQLQQMQSQLLLERCSRVQAEARLAEAQEKV